MSKWHVTIQRTATVCKRITVNGPMTAQLAQSTALEAMDWKAGDCVSVGVEPAGEDAPATVTTIEAQPLALTSIDEQEDETPQAPMKKKAARKKATTKKK